MAPSVESRDAQRCTAAADALGRLEGDANVWIATASADGRPHLVPLSLAWDRGHMCKASLDSADDVVLIDADVEVMDFASVEPETAARFAERVGWSPADEPGAWSLLIVTPRTVRAWNGLGETVGRTIMRHGTWVDGGSPR